jgi:hypothetical protein
MKDLVKIQTELKVPKGNFNSFGKYKYRSCEDILEAVKPILLKYNAVLSITDDVVLVGSKLFVKAVASLLVNDKEVSANGFAELSEHKGMSSEQATGTASSYARKYALNGLFLIDETEADADSQKPQQPVKPTKEALDAVRFESMIKAINIGKASEVKAALSKYTVTPQQQTAIDLAIKENTNK